MPSLRYEILLPLLLFLEASLGQQESGNGFKTQVQIEEHGMKYHQTVEYDPVTTAVTITVPKHGHISASTVIMHKPSDTQMLMDPLRKQCQLKKVPADFDPQDMVFGSQHMAANNQVLSPETANEVKVVEVKRGKLSLPERKELLKSIRDLCQGMPIYIVEEIDVTDADYENGFITLNATDAHKRRTKRAPRPFFIAPTCRNLADRCTPYKIPGAQYCQWFITCPRKIQGRPDIADSREYCKVTHFLNDQSWYCTACCDDSTHCKDNVMCRCDAIYSGDTFLECQERPRLAAASTPPSNPFDVPVVTCNSAGEPVNGGK